MEEQKKLERRYEDLIEERATMKGMSKIRCMIQYPSKIRNTLFFDVFSILWLEYLDLTNLICTIVIIHCICGCMI